jgi:drug/metabolite transporter (DMT)-like permease
MSLITFMHNKDPERCDNTSTRSQTFMTSIMFSMSSISMILLNKTVVLMFPFSAFVLILQNVVTIFLLKSQNVNLGFSLQTALSWTPCVLLFCINTYSSLRALTYISVPTFTVFRNIQPLISSVVDFLVRRERISASSVVFLCIIICGAYLYAHNDLEYNAKGYAWSLIHIFSMSFYSVSVKLSFEKLKLRPVEMSWYNNIMSLGILTGLAYYEFLQETPTTRILSSLEKCSADGICKIIIAASCVGGYFVSVNGFNAQEVLTPTSWLTLNNLSKIPALIISCMIWNVNMNMLEVIGLAISLTGGYLYAMERQGLLSGQRFDEME